MSPKKVAIVTGANKGLGYAIVKELCEKSFGDVFLTSRDEQRGLDACSTLKALGLNPCYHQLDITDVESTAQFVNHIREKYGKIDLVVNNAGVLLVKDSLNKIVQAERTLSVNFDSLVRFTESILPHVKCGGGIFNISSSSGHLSRIPSELLRQQFQYEELSLEELTRLTQGYLQDVREGKEEERGWGPSPYVVSKVAVNAYTFMLDRRLRSRGISVNCFHPGYVMTDMTGGVGSVTAQRAAAAATSLMLSTSDSGAYYWHDGTRVPWDGADPRGYIDGRV